MGWLLALGIALAEQSDFSAAERHLRQAVEMRPASPDLHYNLGLVLSKTQKVSEAAQHFGEVLMTSPRYPGARRALGVALQQGGDLEAAAAELQGAVTDFPDDYDARNTLGTVLMRLGRVSEAVRHFQEVIRLNPSLVKAHRNLAQAYQRAGSPGEARDAMQRSVEVAKQRADFNRAILSVKNGRSALEDGKPDEAVAALREAVALSPRYEDAHYYLGVALTEVEEEPADALRCFETVLELNPQRAEAHFQLGLIFLRSGQRREALAALRKSVDLAPSLVAAQRTLGKLADELGDEPTARAAVTAALVWEPQDSELRNWLAEREQPARP